MYQYKKKHSKQNRTWRRPTESTSDGDLDGDQDGDLDGDQDGDLDRDTGGGQQNPPLKPAAMQGGELLTLINTQPRPVQAPSCSPQASGSFP
ncbi:hypothetical protein ACOMHN_046569 [Nucella lapillus]